MYIYDLYSGNMQSALEHGCGKQTPSASKSFFRANVLHVSNVKHIAHLQMCYMFVMSKCRKESDHIAHLQKCYMFLIHVYPHMQMCYMFVMLGSLKEWNVFLFVTLGFANIIPPRSGKCAVAICELRGRNAFREVTHMNESRHIYKWVMSHIWMSHVTYMNESRHLANSEEETRLAAKFVGNRRCEVAFYLQSNQQILSHTQTHTHTHTYTHRRRGALILCRSRISHIHTHTNTHIHWNTNTLEHTRAHAHTQIRTHTHAYTHKHTRTHTHTHAHTHTRIHWYR